MDRWIVTRALKLIPRSERMKGIALVVLLAFTAILDIFSLASFLPLLVLIINPGKLSSNEFLSRLHDSSGIHDPQNFAIALTVFAVILIIIKTQIIIWVTYRKAKFGYAISEFLVASEYSKFLASSYTRFAGLDYAREMNRITNLPLVFSNNIIIPAGTILAESVVIAILLSVIVIVDPQLFLFLTVLIAPVFVLYRMQKQKIRHSSDEIKTTYPQLLKYTLQGIESFVEIKSFRKEDYFRNRINKMFGIIGNVFAKDHSRNTTISRITEAISAIYLGLIIIYILLFYPSKEEAILILGIYAGVSFRAIPSINRIFSAFMQIRTHEYAIDDLESSTAYQSEASERVVPLRFDDKIQFESVSFAYDGGENVLNDLDLSIHKGEKIIISGNSGRGKTTILLLLMRFLKEQQGKLVLDGRVVEPSADQQFRALMGYVPQNPYILDATIAENIAFGIPRSEINLEKIRKITEDLDLSGWVESLPQKHETIIGEKGTMISGGQRQRIAIGRVLYHDAEVLLLDEITNQLDPRSEKEVLKVLFELAVQKKTVVLITHKEELWNAFDSVYILKEHKLEPHFKTEKST